MFGQPCRIPKRKFLIELWVELYITENKQTTITTTDDQKKIDNKASVDRSER
jgi:hypothetical protein